MTTRQTRDSKRAPWQMQRLVLTCASALILLAGCNKQHPADTATTEQPNPSATTPAPTPVAPENQPAAANQPPANQSAATQPAPAPAPPPAQQAAPPPPPPPPPKPTVYTVPSGTHIAARISQTIDVKQSNPGDPFSGALAQSVHVNGVSVLRAGTPVSGTIIAAKDPGRFKGAGELTIALTTVGGQSVTTEPYSQTEKGKGKRSAAMIGGGGGGGALIGGLAGGGKGALIGGLVGAGAGTAASAFTGNKKITIPAETVVTFTLTSPIRVEKQHKATADESEAPPPPQ